MEKTSEKILFYICYQFDLIGNCLTALVTEDNKKTQRAVKQI